MTEEALAIQAALRAEAERLGIAVRPIVISTDWDVGPVAVFLFPDDPVTLIDAGDHDLRSQETIERGFAEAGREVGDLQRIIVTHGHNDHIGSARRLQEISGCEVVIHREDARFLAGGMMPRDEVFRSFGYGGFGFGGRRPHWFEEVLPGFTEITGGEVFEAGATRLRIEHHPGHTPGHLWVVEESTGAIFGGDYVLADSPTMAGLAGDPSHPFGARPMLAEYEEALEQMAGREVPVVFASHGPPITDHRELIARRLGRSRERTTRVIEALRQLREASVAEITTAAFGERLAHGMFALSSEVFGRLERLVEEQKVIRRRGEDGVWYYKPVRDMQTRAGSARGGSDG